MAEWKNFSASPASERSSFSQRVALAAARRD
jgi:hypothetical protein